MFSWPLGFLYPAISCALQVLSEVAVRSVASLGPLARADVQVAAAGGAARSLLGAPREATRLVPTSEWQLGRTWVWGWFPLALINSAALVPAVVLALALTPALAGALALAVTPVPAVGLAPAAALVQAVVLAPAAALVLAVVLALERLRL